MKLRPSENLLIGKWIFSDNRIQKDEITKRIELLIKQHLNRIKSDESGWFVLFQDSIDLRYWELSYPDSGYSGGGAPMLKCLSIEEMKGKYVVNNKEEE